MYKSCVEEVCKSCVEEMYTSIEEEVYKRFIRGVYERKSSTNGVEAVCTSIEALYKGCIRV